VLLDDAQRAALDALLDVIVPPLPERGLPGASQVGVQGRLLAEARALLPGVVAGLADLALETVTCYYQDPRVLEAIGVEARPPAPQGYQVIAGDLRLLEPVRRRGEIWRRV